MKIFSCLYAERTGTPCAFPVRFVISFMEENTMKKAIALILSILIITFCSCGKEKRPNYVAYEASLYDGLDGGHHSVDVPLWMAEKYSTSENNLAPETAEIEFNGKTYTGNYLYSTSQAPATYVSHKYRSDEASFAINASTNELTEIMFVGNSSYTSSLSAEECRQIAETLAKSYIDISEYRAEENIGDFLYSVTYFREIDGYKTSDQLAISVNYGGEIFSFSRTNLGSFADISEIQYDNEKIDTAIHKKILEIYRDENKHIGYNINSVVLIRFDDGSIAFLFEITNKFFDGNTESSSPVCLLVAEENVHIPQ